MSLAPGTRLGPYEITSQIGAGGMGEVYRAIDTKLKRSVAVKVLPPSLAVDSVRLARLQREAEVLASLNHSNIAAIHGLEDRDGTKALVMELVEGPTLADRIADGPIPADEAVRIAKQIANAFEAAHDQGVVHRDLKPANVKVRPDGVVKVLDFGLAKAMEPPAASPDMSDATITTPALTHAGVILGTAAYMAPEQASGKPVDKRADIWAFGVVFYEMLTGMAPFRGEHMTETLAAVMKSEPNWKLLPESVSPSLVFVLRRCLQKNPKERLHDIADVRFALEDAFEATSIAEGRLGKARLPVWGRASTLVGGGVLVGLALAAAGWAIVNDRDGVESRPISRFALTFRPGQAGSQFEFSADGQTLVYRAAGPDGVFRLYRRSMDQFDAMPIGDTENGSHPFFSPDGRWLGFSVQTVLKKVSLSGGPAVTLAELPMAPRGASWGTSESIVVGGGSSGLLRVPDTGGNPTSLAPAAEGRQFWYPQVLRGRRAVLFTESRFTTSLPRSDAPEVQILELDTGRRRTLLQGSAGRYVPTGHIVFLREGTIWAVGFDADRLELAGTPMPVVEGIAEGPFSQIAIAEAGSLAYVPGGTPTWRRLVWVDRQGREEFIQVPPRGYTYPRLSPDGAQVAIDVREQGIDLWICDLSRETLARLTFDPAQDEYPVWTRDSRRILFASFRDQAWGVFSQAADGTGNVRRLATGPKELDPLSLSPDGRTLIVRTEGDVVLLPLDQTNDISPLLASTFAEDNAEISPDGQWVAHQSNESGRHEVYVRPFPAVNSGLWQISAGGGSQPLWARNGRELFYLTPAGLMSVPIHPGQSFLFGKASVVLKEAHETYWLSTVGRAYDVSPDGQRFLMLKEEQPSAARIHVVQNWFEDLKRLVTQ